MTPMRKAPLRRRRQSWSRHGAQGTGLAPGIRRPRRDRLLVIQWSIGLQTADATKPLSKVSFKSAELIDASARLGELGREPLFGFALLLGLNAQLIGLISASLYFGEKFLLLGEKLLLRSERSLCLCLGDQHGDAAASSGTDHEGNNPLIQQAHPPAIETRDQSWPVPGDH